MVSEDSFNTVNQLIQDIFPDKIKYRNLFIKPVAENLYQDFKKSDYAVQFSETFRKEFRSLTKAEQSFWYDIAAEIPDNFKTLNLYIRRYEDFCRTCIITDNEVSALASVDHNILLSNKTFQNGIKDAHKFLVELNYLIPFELKKIGYEIIRQEEVIEINVIMTRKLARAIHSRYLHEIKNQTSKADSILFFNPGNSENPNISDFDGLSDDIKYSNIDNAAHIPTKLLSIGYKIRQVKKGFKAFALHLNQEEIETMARVEHIRWSWEKRLNGWSFGNKKDELKKTHPSLIPYEQLSETEKEKDRELVKLIPAFLQDIDYEAYPVSPSRIKRLSYAIKPQSSIHRILDETRELNEQIKKIATLTPEIEEMIRIRNNKIEEAISEVEGSYNYAQHIQETFLPEDLFIRECFPESFILFKPKDLVSGDFYFFSKRENQIIFAAVDCTGHGIPGALISTLGYGILDQAVNEIKLTEPSYILHHLYSKIHRFMRNDSEGTGISDDMDIALCILDTRTNILTYSGVKNPLYHISQGKLIEYPAQNRPDDNIADDQCHFTSAKIQLNNSDTIYLCSDGYSDQFGGKFHKKYQTSRFKSFLLNLRDCSMSEQSERFYEEIEQWRDENNEDQTDDILIIGIRI